VTIDEDEHVDVARPKKAAAGLTGSNTPTST
jgi:hypothetical protein